MRKRKDKFRLDKFLERNYEGCKKYFRESKKYFLVITLLFLGSLIVGLIYPNIQRESIVGMIEELVLQVQEMGGLELTGYIFINNMKVALYSILLGVFAGIFPIIAAIFNGYLIGFVLHEAISLEGILVSWRLFPHGIFELPAIVFALGMGLKTGTEIFSSKNPSENVKYNLKESLRFYVFVIFPLLLVAALIEGFFIWLGL